ncbi:MAG: VOC family protein [Deltaproteobacteria bacterium]|nr:MAG: VOC family protein [Deltaproteobacteria bacterium]
MHHGRFLWFDLMTPDPAAARAFYTRVVGWTLTPWEGPGPDGGAYEMFTSPLGPIGGSMVLPEGAREMGAPPHWLGYLGAEDVDATLAEALALGARLLMPAIDMAEVGRFGVVADPFGAFFGIFTPASFSEDGGRPEMPGMGQFSWHELMTGDVEAAFAFYAKLFGWVKTDAMDMGEMGVYQLFGPEPGKTVGGMMKAPEGMPPCWTYYARVPDLDAALAAVGEAGGQVVNGPMEVPGGDRVAQGIDPQGAFFALHCTKS